MKVNDIVFVEDYRNDIVGVFEVSYAHDEWVSIVLEYDTDYYDGLRIETVLKSKCKLICRSEDRLDKNN